MKQKKSTGKRVLVGILLGLLLLALVVGGTAFFYVNSKLNKLSYTPAGEATPPVFTEEERVILEDESKNTETERIESSGKAPEGDVFQDKDVINILLLGTDMRIPNTNDPGRADAIQIISLNRSTGAIKLISFERGIMVPVPGHDKELLTHSYRWAGPDYMLSLFTDYFLLDMAGYAQVDFEAFIEIIDAIGGIDIELSAMEAWALRNDYYRHLAEGVNHMDGSLALAYCRLRRIDSNWVRIERQRKAIQAVLYKVKGMSIQELNALADVVLPLIHTNLSKNQITSLMLSAPKFLGVTAEQMTVPKRTPGRGAYCDFQAEAERLQEFIYGPSEEPAS